MKVYFMRHAETEWNKLKRINGITDIQLIDQGREKAKAVSEFLKKRGMHFSNVYTSPLSRAVETGELVADVEHSYIKKSSELIERNFGKLEGMYYGDLDFDEIEKESENHMDIYRRIIIFMKRLTKQGSDDNNLVITHNSILRHIYTFINKSEYQVINFDNLGYFVAEYNNKRWKIVTVNEKCEFNKWIVLN